MKSLVGSLFFTAFLAVLITLSGVAQAQDSKPNILFIVSDDTGYGDLVPKCYAPRYNCFSRFHGLDSIQAVIPFPRPHSRGRFAG